VTQSPDQMLKHLAHGCHWRVPKLLPTAELSRVWIKAAPHALVLTNAPLADLVGYQVLPEMTEGTLRQTSRSSLRTCSDAEPVTGSGRRAWLATDG